MVPFIQRLIAKLRRLLVKKPDTLGKTPIQKQLKKEELITAVEVFAFFGGIAIIFSLAEVMLSILVLEVDEFIYGLSFVKENFSFGKILFGIGIYSFTLSISITLVSFLFKSNVKKQKNTIIHFIYSNIFYKITFISSITLLSAFFIFIMFFYENEVVKFNIVLLYILIALISIICTSNTSFFGRSILLFSIFLISCILYTATEIKNTNKEIPVTITLQDGDVIFALKCTISREGLAIVKCNDNQIRIIPLSTVKNIIRTEKNKEK